MTSFSKSVSVTNERICSPGYVRGKRTSPTTASLTWDEPYATCSLCPDAVGYEVSGEGIATINIARPPCVITGLDRNASYFLTVYAKAAGNNVSKPSLYRVRLFPPSKPGVPVLTNLSHASVMMKWAASENGVIRYRVYLNGSLVAQTDDPQYPLRFLRNHTEYEVEIRAVNDGGISEPATVAFKTLLRPPTNLRFRQRNGSCWLVWDPNFGKSPAHQVNINGQVFTAEPGRLSYEFRLADLSPGPVPHHFSFKVFAKLDGVDSAVRELSATVWDDVPPTQPGIPQVSNITDTSATVTWAPSSDNVGVTGYRVYLDYWPRVTVTNTQCTFENFISGSNHVVSVRAIDKDGNLSDSSGITLFQTTGQASEPPPHAPIITIMALTSAEAELKWSYPERGAGIGVRISINDEFYKDVSWFLGHYRVLRDLVPDVQYKIEVRAWDGNGLLSEPATLFYTPKDVTPPTVPGNLRIDALTSRSVTLVWEESTDDIGMCDYVIYNNREYFDRTPMNHYTAVDLFPGSYAFEVCALDVYGNASEPASIVVEVN